MTQALATQKTMSSLEIAELTGTEHRHVLEKIRKILAECNIDCAVFSAQYKDSSGRMLPCFNLPRRECDLIIAGYSAKYRLAIIDRWRELENMVNKSLPDFSNPVLAARAWADEVEAKQLALAQIEADKPKVEFAIAVRNLDGSCEIGEFAAVIGVGRNTFFKQLRTDRILMRNNRPYQVFKDRGIFVEVEHKPFVDNIGKSHPTFQTRVTGKGQVWLEKKYREAQVVV
jgi:phage antirepressor YoqD-like protein